MSHALLLRLFLSPSFFSVHVALRYLMVYSDNIGITYYLTRRLKELDTQELREVWGFICHLLVTRPSKSRALECFVVDISQRSTHIAMITLWLMQASLQDLSSSPSSPSFQVCQRTLQRCHEIIFGDLPTPVSPYSGLDLPFQARFSRRKVKTHVEPVLIGLGLMLAGTPAMPKLTEIMGEVALQQGRADEDGSDLKSLRTDENDVASGSGQTTRNDSGDDDDNASDGNNEDDHTASSHERPSNDVCGPHGPAVSEKRTIVNFRRTNVAAQTSPALVHLQNMHRSTLSEDPLDQLDPSSPARVTSPYQSSPSIPTTQHPFRQSTLNFGDSLLQRYDLDSQAHLLRSHYYRSEVQFLITLEHISNRLLVVPKPARVSALRAELTALNHKLPAEVCMPMWCSSSDNPVPRNDSQPHHKIVRIPPGESVVLNSAERVPYLLIIEILHDDLDFDPTKRRNKETLKRIVTKENERKGASRELIAFTRSPLSLKHKALGDPVVGSENALGNDSTEETEASSVPVASATSSTSSLIGDDEEMDLVEQLYGAGESHRGPIDLTESIVLPPVLKNKELDMVAWSRTSSLPSSPNPEGILSLSSSPAFPTTGGRFSTLPSTTQLPDPPPDSNSNNRILSLDDYSERMRTAAVMLSQLNANLIREAVTTLPSSDSTATLVNSSSPYGPLSWLPGSGWLGGPHHQANSGPLHPSLAGRAGDSPATTRMRVQHAEAAAIRGRIMKEMIALEEERMERMREHREGDGMMRIGDVGNNMKTAEDETIIKRELNKVDPSAVIFSESWATKKSRIQHGSPYGHLANWDCVSVIVKTGGDLRQEQVAVQLIQQFEQIWQEENCQCWVRYFQILTTGASSGLVETITDAVSIHSIKKSEYARRLAEGRLGYVTLLDHFKSTYGDPSMAKFVRAQRNFAKSLAGYSIVTYLLQIKDRHNGNILLDREGHLIHIDFGFMLSNSPGNIGFEAAPFKLPPEYVEVLGGVDGESFLEFKRLFREGFEAARKHCDRIITLVELMQKDSKLPCFAAFGDQTAAQLRDRFQPALTHSLVGEYIDRLIDTSLGSNWTRLYDSYQYYSQSIL
ncbi:kinase-like protein [Suillus clintonianus]|uniref:kinase-like protein n=1 Tax=Suillus clintonianus TaxID=1904413 RepID=UPI001B860483|nr:kinase-like protein [Suillus clintonianus]KAG2157127.1 kinase-like protein [Suillus clintonianus]